MFRLSACGTQPVSQAPSFNPLNRGRGIQTLAYGLDTGVSLARFNPLNRGRGVQTFVPKPQQKLLSWFQSSQ